MKKIIALLLVLAMALSLVACGAKSEPAATEAPKAEAPPATGSVYYLNFKPEQDQAWQDLAVEYSGVS